jgi:hypothetical protein
MNMNGNFINFEAQQDVPSRKIDGYIEEHHLYGACSAPQYIVNEILTAIKEKWDIVI